MDVAACTSAARASLDGRGDDFRSDVRIVVFPNPDREPTRLDEFRIGLAVSSAVRFNLLLPPAGVRLRPGRVLLTPVPKTAVDEDRDSRASENNVGFTS